MNEGKYSHSSNGEYYCELFDTREEALADAIATYDGASSVWTGLNVVPRRYINGNDIIEQVACSTTEEAGDWADGYLLGIPKETVQTLEDRMQAVWDEWEKEHGLEPDWFNVEDTQEHFINEKEEA